MGLLRLHPDSLTVLEHWWSSLETSELDRHLVHELLTQLESGGLPQCQFFHEQDAIDISRTNIFARDGLIVSVRMFTDDPDQFAVVAVVASTRHPDA